MLRSIQQLEALRDDWDTLAARFRNPLLDHDWLLSCAEAFHTDGDLCVLVARNAGALVGAAPLALSATPRGSRLTLLGASKLFEPGDWICASDDALAALLDQAIRTGEPTLMTRVPADSPLCVALRALPAHRALTLSRSSSPSLAVKTRRPWDVYYASLSSLVTRNLPRIRRKAEKALGRLQITLQEPRVSEIDALLETVVAVEGSGWKGRAGSALQKRPELRDFFARYGRRAAAQRRVRVAVLSFGSHVAAVELSIEAYDRMWQLKIGYNEAVAQYYPGLLLTEASLKTAFDRGLEAYEFLGSAEPWEERWRPEARLYRVLAIYPFSARGVAGACRDLAGAFWGRVQRSRTAG
jgi:CelD/BcsL family acetyltransferase involved in cellulose biosynthesis